MPYFPVGFFYMFVFPTSSFLSLQLVDLEKMSLVYKESFEVRLSSAKGTLLPFLPSLLFGVMQKYRSD